MEALSSSLPIRINCGSFQARHQNLINGLDAEFDPKRFGNWFYKRIKEWSESNPKGSAFVHVFRKTTLQYARSGEDIARQVANDAGVSESVLMTNYAKQTDVEARQRSNRTYRRILASLSPEVAVRYGHVQDAGRKWKISCGRQLTPRTGFGLPNLRRSWGRSRPTNRRQVHHGYEAEAGSLTAGLPRLISWSGCWPRFCLGVRQCRRCLGRGSPGAVYDKF